MANMISTIYLCNVDFTPINQRYFTSQEVKNNYFRSKVKHTFTNCKYQARSDKMIVKGYILDVSDCNYGYYVNEYQGRLQTFYFWIVGRDATARNSTELTIQLDVIQTWDGFYNLLPCMVEREHVYDDLRGLHTYPEDFEIGDYIQRGVETTQLFNDDVVYIIAESGQTGTVIGGLYNACKMLLALSTTAIDTYIKSMCDSGKGDAITYIYSYPKKFLKEILDVDKLIAEHGTASLFDLSDKSYTDIRGAITKTITVNNNIKDFIQNGIDYSYTPKNNKLYTYPYNFITIMTPYGNSVVLKYELFDTHNKFNFKVIGTLTQNPKFLLVPQNYNGRANDMQDSIELGGFGLCSWNNDNYANWYAQNSATIKAQSENAKQNLKTSQAIAGNNYINAQANRELSAGESAINSVAQLGGVATNPAQAIIGAGATAGNGVLEYMRGGINANNDLANANLLNTNNYETAMRSLMASVTNASVQPNTARGDLSANGIDICTKSNDFYICHTQIKAEYAERIDKYFTMFGYKVNEIKSPQYDTRKVFNFIKTVGCNVTDNGSYATVPQQDKQMIESFFDNGIRFWRTSSIEKLSQIGNYDVDNSAIE